MLFLVKGIYREKQKHENDFEAIMDRAKEAGLVGHMVTGGSLSDRKVLAKIKLEAIRKSFLKLKKSPSIDYSKQA